jgi:hypothetical protein
MLDETFSEARNLLKLLFETYGRSVTSPPVEIFSHTGLEADERSFALGDLSISDASIAVNDLRRRFRTLPFIHAYLPDMIIRNHPDDILRLVGAWKAATVEYGTVEFYLLPRGAFGDLEKKLLSVVDGAVEVRIARSEQGFRSTFTPVRLCHPEYHLHEFAYLVSGKRLLVEWEGEYTDELRTFGPEQIKLHLDEYRENAYGYHITEGPNRAPSGLPIYDIWLLGRVIGRDLDELLNLFPERHEELLSKIARWHLQGILTLVRREGVRGAVPGRRRRMPSMATRSALLLPDWLVGMLFGIRRGAMRMVPSDIFFAHREATNMLLDILLAKEGDVKSQFARRGLRETEKRFTELIARVTALEHIRKMDEDPKQALDRRHIPKMIRLTVRTAYSMASTVHKISDEEYQVRIERCFLCEQSHQEAPICAAIEGALEAVLGIVFKLRSGCEEIHCRAAGDPACVFRVRLG